MKKSMPLLQAAAFCIIVIVLLPGCNKIDSTAATTTDEVVPCQVQQMVYPPLTSEELSRARARTVMQISPMAAAAAVTNNDTAVFTYNALGNPVSIIHQRNIGDDNLFFKYDHANRLTDFIIAYANAAADGGDQWHRYSYDPHNTTRIIADTDYISYETDNGMITSYDGIELTTFQYDAQNRISKTTLIVLANTIDDTIVTAYSYDSHGNLEAGGAVYDNKINVHRTNKIWMFVDNNYSVNNPVDNGTYTYNQGDLPLTIATNSSVQVAGFDFMVIGYPNAQKNVTIGYACKL
jgi:hypothetical protein